jgi:CHAD domain-containing protein
MSPSIDLQTLLAPRQVALERHLPGGLRGSVTAVHQARVASRRLREVLPLLQGAGPKRVRRATREVRRITQALGPVRELDVTLQLLADLQASRPDLGAAVRLVRRAVAMERRLRRQAMIDALTPEAVAKVIRTVRALGARLDRAEDDRGEWRRLLASRAADRGARLEAAIEDVGLLFDAARLHQVRIAAKKLRYTLELMAEAGLAPTARLVRILRGGQDQLGRLHDLQVLLLFVKQAEDGAGRAARTPLSALRDLIERECHREHARYLRRRPSFVDCCRRVAARASDRAPVGAAQAFERRRARNAQRKPAVSRATRNRRGARRRLP